mgnify:CR=1 FL=1
MKIKSLYIKDERERFNLGSFKATGATYAIAKMAYKLLENKSDVSRTTLGNTLKPYTFVTASAGNHGISMAVGARLFGSKADDSLKARFRVIKLSGSNITDSDLKNKTVEAIKEFFDSSNWDFGETFYFTELAAYVHKKLAGVLSSFVIVPQGAGSVFGDMFEYTPNSDQLIIPDVSVNDIDIIQNITDENIRAGT